MATTIFWNFIETPSGEAESFLSPAEQAQLGTLRFDRRRRSFLAGRQAAKRILRQHPLCADLPATAITVSNAPGGAPFALANGRELPGCISLSHREDAAAAALCLAPGISVGIDLEVLEEHSAAFVEDFFTAEESASIQTLRERQRTAWVASVWSAKEAVLKGLKVGLSVDSRDVSIFVPGDTPWQDGWQPLHCGGPALAGYSCRVWRRLWGKYVLTVAVLAKQPALMADNEIKLKPIPAADCAPEDLPFAEIAKG